MDVMKLAAHVLLLVMVLSACTPAAPTLDPFASGAPVTVEVGRRSFTIYCFGNGSPVVLLEGGLGTDWSYWANVYMGLPDDIRVCTYNRSAGSHTSREYARDLHDLLAAAHLKGPYVLVGHSFGGFSVILFADRYPDEVAGMVFEDISHPDQDARSLAVLPPESPDESPDLKIMRQWWSTPQPDIQGVDWTASCKQVRAVKSLGELPLIVLTAAPPYAGWETIPDDIQAKLDVVRLELQKELAGLSTNSRQIIAATTEHNIHLAEPQLVIAAIIRLVNGARNK